MMHTGVTKAIVFDVHEFPKDEFQKISGEKPSLFAQKPFDVLEVFWMVKRPNERIDLLQALVMRLK